MSEALTTPQRALLARIKGGDRVNADYLGGDSGDYRNWCFTLWDGDELENCDIRARALLNAGMVEIYSETPLGHKFLRVKEVVK